VRGLEPLRHAAGDALPGLYFPKELYFAKKLVSVGFSFPFAGLIGAAWIVSHGSRMDTRCFRCDDLWVRSVAKWAGWIVIPPRLPFHHSGAANVNLSYRGGWCDAVTVARRKSMTIGQIPGT
jgi:hypothetical protein